MIRTLHRWPGVLAAVFLIVLTLSGATLSVFPALERVAAPAAVPEQSIAALAGLVTAQHAGVEQIRRAPSGKITVWWFDGDTPGSAVVDPATGQDIGSADPNAIEQWVTEFHRSLFLDDTGRIVMAVSAFSMLVLALTGGLLVMRRVGGWRRWFSRQRSPFGAAFLHTELARVAVPFLLLSAFTALWMTASTFDFLPVDEASPVFPAQVSGDTGFAIATIPTFQTTPISELRDLRFPTANDATDVYTLTTAQGAGYIDQGNGSVLAWATPGPWTQVWDWVYLLHTGQGAALWGLILGLAVMSVPVLAVTGVIIWVKSRRARPRLRGMATAAKAQTVLLVGSEGGSTWGFAATLARALQAAGQTVHLAPLSGFAPQRYSAARQIIVMTATWGDGAAPSSANGALARLAEAQPSVPLAVLGFGDSSFPAFCGFAKEFEAKAREIGWTVLLPMDQIDRQSPQEFARWGRDLGAALGVSLELEYYPIAPNAAPLTLVSRRDYGESLQAPAAILRFALPKSSLWQRLTGRGFGRFAAGDLLGIVPEGATLPRYYSLASGLRDGFFEIAVRKHQGGLCSGQLMGLQPGQSVQAFLRRNPDFHADAGRAPLILIGAGTGVGPLAGFIRSQGGHRPIHLWFGIRHPDTDYLYGQELEDWRLAGQLTGLHTAFSRSGTRQYVQDALRQDAETLRSLIRSGAKVMVCGGRDMATGVRAALADILAPSGQSAVTLKAEGRYAEDVY
ncbi:PepSY domain-containing protein [Pseudorhodobacter sp. W20_MBD10_FR17]|uniref:PepSY domain-containing protein n=1 Tax=Pseudorhodobacter sp. W20_MBD10_FR17 TaxID=3240266 RepID=UPI003F9B7037